MNESLIRQTLVLHQRRAVGMTSGAPDVCACGERVDAAPREDGGEIMERRDFAFATHQTAMILAAEEQFTTMMRARSALGATWVPSTRTPDVTGGYRGEGI